jgi:hypothetical protein
VQLLPPPALKVWEPAANVLLVEFTAPLTVFQAFAVAVAVMA